MPFKVKQYADISHNSCGKQIYLGIHMDDKILWDKKLHPP